MFIRIFRLIFLSVFLSSALALVAGCENNSDEEVLHKLLESNLDGVGAQNHSKLSPVFVNKILEAGKKVHVWTVDNVDEAKNYKAIGLSSITTNVPGLIKSSL
ncbi:MAG TPA: hypothetical protein EYN84_01120 [Gammaproteobacteria bacterium]|nr:hypothetical protein [Gammaproteobacteria bacterium]